MKALRYADALGEKLADRFSEIHLTREGSSLPELDQMTAAILSNWLVHSSIETLRGWTKETGNPEPGQLGDSLRDNYVKEYAESLKTIRNQLSLKANVSVDPDPFQELDALRHEVWPVTILLTQNHVIAKIMDDSNIPEGEETVQNQLRLLMRVGMMMFSKELNFQNPYELLPEDQ